MATIRLQGNIEKRRGVFYQVDTDDAPIGEGGMGKVFKGICVNERNGASRPVAIKFMFDDLPTSAYERARRESEIQLRNDNLVEMLGFIETQELNGLGEVRKHYHVVSELLTGVPLSDIFEGKTKNRNGEDVPFAVKMLQNYKNDPEHFATIVVVNVLSGLMALHDAGYIHRDIDPSNIMLTDDGHIKLIDFGIAKQMNNLTTGDKALTVAGKFMGKPEYAAPELALGDVQHQNQTTDIYAVGILLYQCILGHTPFEGARHEILEMQLKAKIPLGKIKSKALKNIIATACNKKQELRYQTSSQMRVAIENINGARREMSTSKKIAIALSSAALIAILIAVTLIVKHKQDVTEKQAEVARVEQRNAEIMSDVEEKILAADRAAKLGLSKEADDYEKQLMAAYSTYTEAEQIIKKNAGSGLRNTNLTMKKKELLAALDSAQAEMTSQAAALEEMGETDLANTYKERVKGIVEFKNRQK